MSVSIPARLINEQWPNVLSMLSGAVISYLPFKRVGALRERQLPAPSNTLVDAYASWSRAAPGRYADTLPPPMISSQVALGLVARLTAESPYPMLSVLNQGVHVRLNAAIPRGQPLQLSGRLVDASDDGYRARVHVQVQVGTAARRDAVIIDSFAAVPLKRRPERDGEPRQTPAFETVGHWQAAADEGVKFFRLTGDFNPIHTLPALARRTAFKGCIMHGYGAFSQVFEALRNAGHAITEIDLRFVKPLPLPSPPLLIQVAPADDDGWRPFRLCDATGNVYQVGRFLADGHGAI